MEPVKDYVVLNTGAHMPIIGLGTWTSKDDEVETAVEIALELGYRHFDTAYMYLNEKEIGRALKKVFQKGKIKREDVFIVSKLPTIGHKREKVPYFLKKTLEDLQVDYIDLYLIHTAFATVGENDLDFFARDENGKLRHDYEADLVDTWKGMEDAVDLGMTKAIGLSNFNSQQIKRIYDNARIKPANLQVECHAYFPQNKLFEFCKNLGITFTSYGPIGSPGLPAFMKASFNVETNLPVLIQDPALVPICKKYNKTAAQVLLRWLIQRGIIVIPKSTNPSRIKENFQVFDFNLSKEDFSIINGLDKNLRLFSLDGIPGFKESPEYPYNIEF